MKHTIINTFKRQRESELVTTGHRITEKMENNPNFSKPPASLADLKKILPEFQAALVAAKGREKETISVKNDKKAKVLAYLTELAQYVNLSCNGDKSLLLSSGFDIAGSGGKQSLPVIEKLQVDMNAPGMATTRIKKVAGARSYVHQYTRESPSSNSVWISEVSLTHSYTFKGLNSMTKYWFRVGVLDSSGETVFSPTVERVIQ